MEVERYEHGVPSWVDLGTPDIPKAIEFYSGLFGWQIEQGPPEAGGYSMALMKQVVAKLTLDDMIALAAYVGSLDP